MNILRMLRADRRGASSIEYALIAMLIAVAAIAGYQALGDNVETSFNNTADKL